MNPQSPKEKIQKIMQKLQNLSGRNGTQERVGLSDQLDIQVLHSTKSREVK